MVSGPGAEPSGAVRTPQCVTGEHADCPHRTGWLGTFNPGRLRFEIGVPLCPCDCHAPCPVAVTGGRLTVPTDRWLESCACPGAEQERRKMAEAGVQSPERLWRERRASKAALDAARTRSRGKTREEARDIYEAELRARGVTVPPGPILDATAIRLAASPGERAVMSGRALADVARAIPDLLGMRRKAREGRGPGGSGPES